MKKFSCIILLLAVFSLFLTSCESVDFEKIIDIVGDVAEAGAKASTKSADSIAKAFEQITPENEYYIGRSVAASLLTHYEPAHTPEMNRYLTIMANSIAALDMSHSQPYKGYFVAVLDTDEINAFATSGGHIFITRGFISAMENEDQLAAVIAHEMSHVQLQHGLKTIKTNRGINALLDFTGNFLEYYTDGIFDKDRFDDLLNFFDQVVGVSVDTLLTTGYSQTQEFEADKNAVELLTLSGYNPSAMYEMLSKINTPSANYGSGFGKTHPNPQSRIDELHDEYPKLPVQITDPVRTARFLQQLKKL